MDPTRAVALELVEGEGFDLKIGVDWCYDLEV